MDRLLKVGFRNVGSWLNTSTGIGHEIREFADSRNVLYCFISDQTVLYVGKTVQCLKKRLNGYQNPGPSQTTNIKVNAHIRKLLANGKGVDIFALRDESHDHRGDFHINIAAGLEDSVIEVLQPVWNKTGTNKNRGKK